MAPRYMTVVIKMPEDREQRNRICDELSIGKQFHGGEVTAASAEDEMGRVERFEALLEQHGIPYEF